MSEMMSPGFYGKLPALGDFISRRLPHTFIEPWDRWLQTALVRSREQLGNHWLDTYLTSPMWRFVLASGVCGPAGWSGVLMPSVDRVGRYFPLTLACPLPKAMNPFLVAGQGNNWYEGSEALALSVLEEGNFSLDAFDEQVERLGLTLSSCSASEPEDAVHVRCARDGDAWYIPLPCVDGLGQVLPALLQPLISQHFGGYSLWWSAGSERVKPGLWICQGLPAPDGFASLLGGHWPEDSGEDWADYRA